MWQGENLGDVQIKRYFVATILQGNKVVDFPKTSRGYKAGQLISAKGSEPDNPGEHSLRPKKPTTVLFVADGNGSKPNKLKVEDYPFSYRTNCYEVAISKKLEKYLEKYGMTLR